MLNTTIHRNMPSCVSVYSKSETHEHRAPTDQSVELLREMQCEAMNSVIERGSFTDNTLKAEWALVDDPMRGEQRARCRFKLNGNQVNIDIPLPYRFGQSKREWADALLAEVNSAVARALCISLCRQHQDALPR